MDSTERTRGALPSPGPNNLHLADRDANVVACWSCHGPVEAVALFCATCDAVQPPGQADHFSRLGLAVNYDVDAARLDASYFERQRRLHPDRFATRSARERVLSQQQATALNGAYETLRDPLRRADYLLHFLREGASPEGCHLVNDPVLLTEAMELREALAEAETPEAVAVLVRRAVRDIEQCVCDVGAAFATHDLDRAAQLTTRLKYLRKLADDCRARRLRLVGAE
jgi:molecular chaperone HscB